MTPPNDANRVANSEDSDQTAQSDFSLLCLHSPILLKSEDHYSMYDSCITASK